ncbi:MAG: MATE family efflux transporter [Clostridia bacterium]|nr:MATE family efflux transporter [Clostridia bacterium]
MRGKGGMLAEGDVMTLTKQKTLKLTEGPLFSKIVLFILPLMLSNLLQICYNAADMMIVGLSAEENAVGAIGTTGALIALIVNVFIGFSTGANVMIARHIGAKKDELVSRTVHTALAMSAIFGVVSAIAGFFFSRPILELMGAKAELLDLATLYTKIYFLGVPFISIANYAISIFRAKGDTKTPLYVLSLTGVLNVALNLFFVLVCDMSVDGVAYATSISNLANAVILVALLMREDGPCRFRFKKLCLDRRAFGEILYIGLPSGLQSALFSLSNILIQSSILRVNNAVVTAGSSFQPVVSGNAAAANLENFAFTAVAAVHQATVTFTGQNAGAEKYDRVCRVMKLCMLCSLAVALFFTLLIFLLHTPLFALYGVVDGEAGSLEHVAFNAAYTRIFYHLLPFVLYAFFDTTNAMARGLKKAISATVITLIGTCLLRVVWILTVFEHFETLESIYVSYPLSWLLTGAVQFVMVLTVLKKQSVRTEEIAQNVK